jgi:hypothetical protein
MVSRGQRGAASKRFARYRQARLRRGMGKLEAGGAFAAVMLLCEKCGRVIQSYEVKYRLEVDGRRRNFCNEDAKELLKGSEAPKGAAKPAAAKPPAPVVAGAPAAAPTAAPTAAAPAAAPAGPPKFTPEELEARKKAALEKAAAAKAAKAGEPKP